MDIAARAAFNGRQSAYPTHCLGVGHDGDGHADVDVRDGYPRPDYGPLVGSIAPNAISFFFSVFAVDVIITDRRFTETDWEFDSAGVAARARGWVVWGARVAWRLTLALR